MTEERTEGKVKWYSVAKGYGFIEGDDGEDYFIHHSEVPQATILQENDAVTFETAETEKGLQARNLELAE